MIDAAKFTKELIRNDLSPVVEVPCSYLKDFLNYLWDSKKIEVINPVNEAIAMGIASGYYLSTRKLPIVAIQNSGLMNTLNALTSLNQIYEIPIFYIVTWRGEGGKGKDAPEHDITGANLKKILSTFDLPYEIVDQTDYAAQIKRLSNQARKTNKPVVLVIRKNTFEEYPKKTEALNKNLLTRYEAISIAKNVVGKKGIYLSSTGFPTRDSYAASNTKDFYMVGSMGHLFPIAIGVSANTRKKVIVFDGDGASLMHSGGLGSFNPQKNKNLIYIVLDNKSYESTGGQPLTANVDFAKLGKAFSFPMVLSLTKKTELTKTLKKAIKSNKAYFIHFRVNQGGGKITKRVSDDYSCPQIKERFMEELKKE
jgi:phosphonopyruvate decarboxylase